MTYIAGEALRTGNGAIAYAAGSEVPEEALITDVAKAYGWKDSVTEIRTKTVRADGPGTDKPTQPATAGAVTAAQK